MASKDIHNQILRGQFGKVWIDGELYANVKSFEAKISLKYEAVDINGEMGTHQRLVGFEGALSSYATGLAISIAVMSCQSFSSMRISLGLFLAIL